MADHSKGNAVRFYIIIALILMALTYLEFAIVEYEVAFLNNVTTIVALVGMSILKFALVVAIYMHLRDDDPIYTRFFSSGLVIAMGTFIALSFLFTVRSVMNTQPRVRAQEQTDEASILEDGETILEEKTAVLDELAEERPKAESFRVPAPKSQRVRIPLPEAQMSSFSLKAPGEVSDEGNESSTEDGDAAGTDEADNAEAAASETADGESNEVLAQTGNFDWQALGEKTYAANCVSCHQGNGQGVPSAFPPLAGHIPNLYNAEGGKDYIINVVLYGLMGEIEVEGTTYNGVMNPWGQLSDEEIAATLNHELNSWGNDAMLENFSPILPDDVAALRGQDLSSSDVAGLRPDLP